MTTPGIPQDVEDFVRVHLPSVEALETLLLLHARASAGLTAAEAARALGVDEAQADRCLARFVADGLARSDQASKRRYAYQPSSLALDGSVAGLALAYARRRLPVLSLITDQPNPRIRSFASAFKLREDS